MRTLLAMTLVAGLLIVSAGSSGCGKPKETPKATTGEPTKPKAAEPTKPEATKPDTKAPPPPAAASITLKDDKVEVEKEKEAKLKIPVERKEYKGEVALKFEIKAKGITVDPADAKIAEGKDDVEVTIKAAKDAESGDIIITATGKDVKDATATIKVTVK